VLNRNDPELRVLRALVDGQPGGLLDGNLVTVEEGRERSNRYPGFRITLRPKFGRGPSMTVTTNQAGHFQFDWVSPGDYILVLDGGSSFANEQREIHIRALERCLTLAKFILRPR
jgi:hypothetical protein